MYFLFPVPQSQELRFGLLLKILGTSHQLQEAVWEREDLGAQDDLGLNPETIVGCAHASLRL